jgi:hypothetical protein
MSGVLQLLNTDSDEGSYDVTVTGTGVPPQRQVVDDGDTGNSFAGNWKRPTGKGYGRDIHYASKGKGYMYSAWGFSNLAPGQYRVYATWPGGGKNASNAPFKLFDGEALRALARANQRAAPGPQTAFGRWKSLGIVSVYSGQLVVTLTNAANGIVVADAVYIEQIRGVAAQPQIFNVDSTMDLSQAAAKPGKSSTTAPATLELSRPTGSGESQAIDVLVGQPPKRDGDGVTCQSKLLMCEQNADEQEEATWYKI